MNDNTLLWILGFTTLAGIASALIASLFLAVPERTRGRILPHLVSFATGALLGAALLALLPHAIEEAGPGSAHAIGISLAAGIGVFFVLEKFVLWRHCHVEQWEGDSGHVHARAHASGVLVLVGDAFHNVLDGVLIAAAFLTDIRLGIVTAIAALVHEIPQEVGDFAVLLHSGMSRARALLLNLAVSLTSVVGAVVAYLALRPAIEYLPYALAVAAACFLYVAVADLIPGLHRRVDLRASAAQFVLIGLGIAVIASAEAFAH
jgi:zinc and cadmium transporter